MNEPSTQPNNPNGVQEALNEIMRLRKEAYQEGYRVGYQLGFEYGISSAMGQPLKPVSPS
jgi:hypothetical protein